MTGGDAGQENSVQAASRNSPKWVIY